MIDRGAAIVIPARPDLNWSPTTQDRVWNTMVKFDQQVNANHTWGVRWLRELSPQRNQAITPPAHSRRAGDPRGRRQGPDGRRHVLVRLRQHQAELAARRLDAGRRGVRESLLQRQRPQPDRRASRRSLSRPSPISRTTPPRRVSTMPIRSKTRSRWFLPNKRGDHDIKFGAQFEFVNADNVAQDNMNGTFTFGTSNAPVQCRRSADLSRSPDDPRPGPGSFVEKAHFLSFFAQDKWKMSNRLTATIGRPLRPRDYSRRRNEQSGVRQRRRLSGGSRTTSSRASACPTRSTTPGRSVARGGYGRFYDKTHFEIIGGLFNGGVFSDSFTVNFPASAADPGPRNGQFPTDPMLVNGPVLNRALLNQLYPARQRRCATPATSRIDDPTRRMPMSDQSSAGYEHQLGAHDVSQRRLRARVRPRNAHAFDKNKGVRAHDGVDGADRQAGPDAFQAVNTFLNVGETDYDALLLQVEKRLSRGFSARVAYTFAARPATPAATVRRDQLPDRAGHEPRPERRSDRLRSPPQPRGQRPHARALHARA